MILIFLKLQVFSNLCEDKSLISFSPFGFGLIHLFNNTLVECDLSIFQGLSLKDTYLLQKKEEKNQFVAILYFSDDNVYEGEVLDFTMHGYGCLKGPQGKIYEGEFREGKFHGFGKLYETEKIHEGFFKEGKKHGLAKSFDLFDERCFLEEWEMGTRKKINAVLYKKEKKFLKIF